MVRLHPPDSQLPGQTDVLTTLLPRGKPARELSEAGRPCSSSDCPPWAGSGDQASRPASSTRRPFCSAGSTAGNPALADAPAVAPLDPKTRRLELASVTIRPQSAPFQAWLDEQELRREPGENEVDFARRAFLAVRKGIKYVEGEEVEHLASRVCEAGKSDYAGITAVYVAALRANGIPARALFGRVVIYEGQPAKLNWPHAKAEFFAPGLGWVPADPAGAIRSNSPPDGLEFFGTDSAEFLTLHLDTDLVIDTYSGRKTVDGSPRPPCRSWRGLVRRRQTEATVTVDVEPLDLTEVLARKPTRPGARSRSQNRLGRPRNRPTSRFPSRRTIRNFRIFAPGSSSPSCK